MRGHGESPGEAGGSFVVVNRSPDAPKRHQELNARVVCFKRSYSSMGYVKIPIMFGQQTKMLQVWAETKFSPWCCVARGISVAKERFDPQTGRGLERKVLPGYRFVCVCRRPDLVRVVWRLQAGGRKLA